MGVYWGFVIVLVVSTCICVLFNLCARKLAYKDTERYLQFRLVISTALLILVLFNAGSSTRFVLAIDKIINSRYASYIIERIFPKREILLVYMLLFVLLYNLVFCVIYILHILIMKLLFWRNKKYVFYKYCYGIELVSCLPWCFVNRFYVSENDKDHPKLTGRGYLIGKWVKWMRVAFAFIWIAEMITIYASAVFGSEKWNAGVLEFSKVAYYLPLAAYFFMGQIQLFFEGPEETWEGSLGSTDISEKMIGSLDVLMRDYYNHFNGGDMLVTYDRGTEVETKSLGLKTIDPGKLLTDDCEQPCVLQMLSTMLGNYGIDQDYHYQNAWVALLNKDPIVCVRDNYEGEFTMYYCAYLNYYLSKGKTALVLCSDRAALDSVRVIIDENYKELRYVNMFEHISDVGTIDIQDTNILICTYDELLDIALTNAVNGFLRNLEIVVMPDCEGFLSLNAANANLLFSRLKSLAKNTQYICISNAPSEDLFNWLRSSLIQTECTIKYCSHDYRRKNTGIMVWGDESGYYPYSVLGINTPAPYIGTAIPLALFAIRGGFPKVYIVPGDRSGDAYFFNVALPAHSPQIRDFLHMDINLDIIRYSKKELAKSEDKKVIILYDDSFNMIEAAWRWIKYAGTEESLIHIISPRYMLREYFAAHFNKFLGVPNEYGAIIPKESSVPQNKMVQLLSELSYGINSEEEILDRAEEMSADGRRYESTPALLGEFLRTMFSGQFTNLYDYVTYDDRKFFVADEGQGNFVEKSYVRLSDRAVAAVKSLTAKAQYKLNGNKYDLPIYKDDIENYYLPQQFMQAGGVYYRITSIRDGVVEVRAERLDTVSDYFDISEFSFADGKPVEQLVGDPLVNYRIFEATVERTIYGYVESEMGNDFSDVDRIKTRPFDDASIRRIRKEHIPVLELRFKREAFKSRGDDGDLDKQESVKTNSERAALLLTVLLQGLFKTRFPHTYQNLYAVVGVPADENIRQSVIAGNERSEDLIKAISYHMSSKYVPDDHYISIFIVEFSSVEFGMLRALYDNLIQVYSNIYDYLDWYIRSNDAQNGSVIKGRYLNFGLETLPDIFAPTEVRAVLKDLILTRNRNVDENLPENKTGEDIPKESAESHYCSFCGNRITFGWMLQDGRKMCAHCHDHQATQDEEITSLYLETKDSMEKAYGITFRENIETRFESADAIWGASDGKVEGRVIGFFSDSHNRMWIEARGPHVAMRSTIAHELTHVWQCDALPFGMLRKRWKRKAEQRISALMEGHAVYVEIEVMHRLGQVEYADWLAQDTSNRDDVYGKGYRLLRRYLDRSEGEGSHVTPFTAMERLMKSISERKDPIAWEEEGL